MVPTFRWRDEHTAQFLDIYRKHECLWNTSIDTYKDRSKREKAYQNIQSEMKLPELTVADIKNKIKIIRTKYNSELNKIAKSEKSAAGLSDVYIPRVFWFAQANIFLRGVYEAKKNTSNLNCDMNLSQTHDGIPALELEEEEDSSEVSKPKDHDNSNMNIPTTCTTTSPTGPSRKRKSNIMNVVDNAINKLQKISAECQDDDDEFDLFCKSIAVQLRKMPIHRSLECQEKLQGVMKQERLFQLRHGLQSSHNVDNQYDTAWSSNNPSTRPTSASSSHDDTQIDIKFELSPQD